MSVAFEPIQSGTGDPSPTNVRPISGRTEVKVGRSGKNQYDVSTASAVKATKTVSNNKIKLTATEAGTWVYLTSTKIPIQPNTDYILSCSSLVESNTSLDGQLAAAYYTADDTYISREYWGSSLSKALTIPANTAFIVVYIFVAYATNAAVGDYVEVTNLQLEVGTSPTAYEPYIAPVTLTIALGQTVYGGNLDVKTGVLTAGMDAIDLGNLDYTSIGENTYIAGIVGIKPNTHINILCSVYRPYTGQQNITSNSTAKAYLADGEIASIEGQTGIYIKDSTVVDAAALKTARTGQKLCYELATPTTVQLTPAQLMMLKGYNSLSTDGGDVITVTAYVKTT